MRVGRSFRVFARQDDKATCATSSSRARYEEITAAVSDQLARGVALEDLMGSRLDALKLVSSLTLFRAADKGPARD